MLARKGRYYVQGLLSCLIFAIIIFPSQAMAQDTTIAPPSCGAPAGTTFHGLTFGSITPSGVFQQNYTLPNVAVVGGQSVDVQVAFDTAPSPSNTSNTPRPSAGGDFLFNTSVASGSRTVTYNFVQAGTNNPVTANFRIRFADIDQNESALVALDQFSALITSASTNLTITDNGTAATIAGAAGNRGIVAGDTVEFVLLNRSSFTATVFPQTPNTGFFFDGDLSLPIGTEQCANILPINANPESFATISGVPGGATSVSILESDRLGADPVSTSIATLSVISIDPRLSLNASTGLVTVAPGTQAGDYSLQYQICEIASPSNCDTVTEVITVAVPVALGSGQTCPPTFTNLLANSSFSGFTSWSQGGANSGNLSLSNYTGDPSGQTFTNVVFEDANSTSGTLFQTVPAGISAGGQGQIRMDMAWNNDGSASTMIFSVAGTNVFSVTTSAANNNIDPADFSFLNGASGIVGDTAFGANASGKIPVGTNLAWDLLPLTIDLPAGLADVGDVTLSYTQGSDDWAIDNFLFCGQPAARLDVSKVSRNLSANEFSVPGNYVIYTITITNEGTGPVDTDSLFVVDSLPPQLIFHDGDFDGPGAGTDTIGFSQSGASMSFNQTSDVAYSDSALPPTAFANCTYTPVGIEDPNVRHICFNPKGTLPNGAPGPEITFQFRTLIE